MKCLILCIMLVHQFVWHYPRNHVSSSVIVKVLKGLKTGLVTVLNGIKRLLPKSKYCVEPRKECPNSRITFKLYTSKDDNGTDLTDEYIAQMNVSSLAPRPWKLLVHGYKRDKKNILNPKMREAYFANGTYNLISVNYTLLALEGCYLSSVRNAPIVANCTAHLIDLMVKKGAFNWSDIHVVGFSLGAQISGQIHRYSKLGKPGRVTGLDPASPFFDGKVNRVLSKRSANFVDVIHTEAMGKGEVFPMGHADFYVNGGSYQRGCLTSKELPLLGCNHIRSVLYYAESVNSPLGFWGIHCGYLTFMYTDWCRTKKEKLVLMGEHISNTTRGIFFMNTNSTSPFALGPVTHARFQFP